MFISLLGLKTIYYLRERYCSEYLRFGFDQLAAEYNCDSKGNDHL